MKNFFLAVTFLTLFFSWPASGVWQQMDSGTTQILRDIWGTGPDNLYAVGDDGTVLHYDGNPEHTWETIDLVSDKLLFGVYGASTDLYVTGHGGPSYGGSVYQYSLASQQWSELPMPSTPANVALEGLWADGTDVFAVGYSDDEKGYIFHWQDGDLLPYEELDLGSVSLDSVWGTGVDDLYVSGKYGSMDNTRGILYHNSGSGWTSYGGDLSGTRIIYNIKGYSDHLFCVGSSSATGLPGQAIHYSGAGRDIRDFNELGDNVALEDVWINSLSDIYAVGREGVILNGTSDLLTWLLMDSGTTEVLHGVWGFGPEVFAVGTNGTILYLPEPATILLFGIGTLAILRKRRI
jgi:hypothetical protein